MNKETWEMPQYPSFFPLQENTQWITDTFQRVQAKMQGKLAMTMEDAAILVQAIVNAGHGDHLEIGSLWGGSAILAALTKQRHELRGKIVCVDDLALAGENLILENAERLDVLDVIELHIGNSHELLFDNNRRFCSALIDAGHEYPDAIQDWYKARNCVDKYAIFHDYDPAHLGVVAAAKEAMREWRPVFLAEHTLILEKP